ncbi:hypothetical protein DFH06DRAFT_1351548 [Mycena polygramma]|nr:hypothetical protein DFH06DRAFT_1351548 [Mycena polygramma]
MECIIRVGDTPNPSVVNRGGTIFVAYNCAADKIPANAWSTVDKVWYFSTRVLTKANGFAQEMEWAKEMDWHRPDRDWVSWIPVVGDVDAPDLPWYHSENDESVIKKTQYGRYLLESELRDAYLVDLNKGWELVHLISQLPQLPPNLPRPIEHSSKDLYLAKDSPKEVMEVLANAKRKMLEYLGWVNWWSCIENRWQDIVDSSTKEAIEAYKLQEYGKRGVLVNLARDYPTLNLLTLLTHNVPFAYAWTVREDVSPRFSRMAPRLLNAYMKKRKELGADFHLFDDAGMKSTLYRSLFDYDPFFQPLPPEFIDAPSDLAPDDLKPDWDYFMIDGEGYGRRSVPEPDWRRYYALRFCFRVVEGSMHHPTAVIFYRHLKKEILLPPKFKFLEGGSDYDPEEEDEARYSSSDEDHIPVDRDKDAKDDDVYIREFSRLRFGPRPGQRYDHATGVEIERPWTGPQTLVRWTAMMNSRVPPSPSSAEFTRTRNFIREVARMIMEVSSTQMDVDGAVIPAALESIETRADDYDLFSDDAPSPTALDHSINSSSSQSLLLRLSAAPKKEEGPAPPALLARLSDRGSLPRTPTEPQGMRGPGRDSSRSRASSSNSSRRNSSDRYGSNSRDRSRSPVRRQGPSSLPPRRRSFTIPIVYRNPTTSQEERMLRWMTSDIASALVLKAPLFPATPQERRWSARYLDKAYLLLKDSPSRVWARVIAASDSTVRTAEDLLDRLMDQGLAFQLAIREEDLASFRPSEIRLVERKWGSSEYSVNVREDPLLYGAGGREFVERWSKRSKEILEREHARVLVSLGGIFAWLALSFSRDTLAPAFKSGPSKQVTVFRRGWTDVADADSLYLVGDEMSAEELDVLLGKLQGEDRYIWPKNEFLWEFSQYYSGAFNEDWLSTLKVIEGELARFEPRHRTRGEFRELFRRANRSDQRGNSAKITREAFEEEELKMNEVFADSWTKISVRSLLLPGVFRHVQAGV